MKTLLGPDKPDLPEGCALAFGVLLLAIAIARLLEWLFG